MQDSGSLIHKNESTINVISAWSVRFPKDLKILGKKYIVDQLVPYKDYTFYGYTFK